MKESKIILITGPTSSGKSNICLHLSNLCKCVIINADSRQIYHEIPIITAQPKICDKKNIKHVMYGYISVLNNYSVNMWFNTIIKEIENAIELNLVPIICGGTGMYISTLLNGLSYIPDISKNIKNDSIMMLNDIGSNLFYKELEKLDPISSSKISNNDSYRMLRAYEVIKQTGISIVEWRNKKKHSFDKKISTFILMPNKDILNKSISDRFERMISSGAIEEAKRFMQFDNYKNLTSFSSFGLSEICKYIEGKITIDEASEKSKIITRQYAKRQRTWFRNKLSGEKFFSNKNELVEELQSLF